MSTRAERLLERMDESEQGQRMTRRVSLALELGELVHTMRRSRHYTQSKLAEYVGTTQSGISRLEGGNEGHIPGLDQILELAAACGYTVNLSVTPSDGTVDDGTPTPIVNIPPSVADAWQASPLQY